MLLTVPSQPPGLPSAPAAPACSRSGVRGACRRSLTAAVEDVMELAALLVHGLTSGACCVVHRVPTAWLRSRRGRDRRHGTWGHLRGRSSARFVCVPGRAWRLLPQTALLGQPSPAPICLWVRAMAKMVQTVQRSVAAAVSAALACLAPSVHALSRGFGACCPVPVSGPGRRLQHGTPLSALWALYVDICRATHAANYQQHK